MDSKILISAIFAVSCVIGFCVVLSIIIYKDKNSEDNTNDIKPTSTDPASKTKNGDPAEPTITTPTANDDIGDDNETNSNQADSNDKESQKSIDKSIEIPSQESLNKQPEESNDNPQPDISQSDLTVTNCEDCKQIKLPAGEKICKNCIETREKKEDESTGNEAFQGDKINQTVGPSENLPVDRMINEPQQNTNLTDSDTEHPTIEEGNSFTGSEEGPIDITTESQPDEAVISGKKDQNSGAKLINQQSGNAKENPIQADIDKKESQPNVDNTTGQSPELVVSNAPQKETLPASNQNQQQSQAISSGNQTKKDSAKTEEKDIFDFNSTVEKLKFELCIAKNGNGDLLEGTYKENPLEQNSNDLFILKNLFVELKNSKTKFSTNVVENLNSEVNSDDLEESVDKKLYGHDLYSLNKEKMEAIKPHLNDFIIYLKETFFNQTEIKVKNIAELRKNFKNIYIIKGENEAKLLFKCDDDDVDIYYDMTEILFKYFNKHHEGLQNKGINNQGIGKILSIFAERINLILSPIINELNIYFKFSDVEDSKDNETIRQFLFLFYDGTVKEYSEFNCVVLEETGALN